MGSITSSRFWKALACAFAVAACLALAACGGGTAGSSSSAASGSGSSAAPESSSAAADPAEKFVGDWKLAAAEMQGLTVTGDFSSGIFGTEINLTFTLAEDKTGTAKLNDETADVTWELDGDDAITITPTESSDDIEPMTATYADGVLTVNMADDELEGDLYLTADGTMEGLREITSEGATEVTSDTDIIGTWKLAGINMMGVSMYGDADDLAAMMGDDEAGYTTFDIASDGTATLMGEDATWEVGSDGVTITIAGMAVPLKTLDGDLVIDAGALMGDLGIDMVMLFTK